MMANELTKPQAALEQLADLNKTLEKEKVQLTPEVEEYTRSHIRAVQNKLQAGEDVHQSDLEFISKVKLWVLMPKEWREKYPSIEHMTKSEEVINAQSQANKRHISLKQWVDLLHIMKAKSQEIEWIDEDFKFPGEGKIETGKNLWLFNCWELNTLPDGLKVDGNLVLRSCSGLTSLPEKLEIGGCLDIGDCLKLKSLPKDLNVGGEYFYLSQNLNEQVKEDAQRLKEEGKIVGRLKYER